MLYHFNKYKQVTSGKRAVQTFESCFLLQHKTIDSGILRHIP